ncbi:MAG: alpha/beta hydrolase fold domain-containing protein, partial [Pseudomonadota bacterium]
VGYYLQGANPTDPLASPAHGTFESPPPSLIFASDAEILCDDATMLADALLRAGGEVRVEVWPGLPHAWPILHGKLAAADRALAIAGAFISGHLG